MKPGKYFRDLVMLCFTFCALQLHAQKTFSIPDPAFRNYLFYQLGPRYFDFNRNLIIDSARKYTGPINCADSRIKNLDGLQYLTRVYMINCSRNPLETPFPELSGFTELKSIWAESCQLDSFPDLNQIKTLQNLSLKDNRISRVPDISNLTDLEYLDLSINKIDSLLHLDNLPDLQKLFAFSNQLTFISEPGNSSQLKILDIQKNKLTRLPSLSKNRNLEILRCAENFLPELPSLAENSKLQELIIHQNELVKLPDLYNNKNLITLVAHQNKLTELPDISKIYSLQNINVTNNKLGFKFLIPLTYHTNYSPRRFYLMPQDTLGVFIDIVLNENSDYLLLMSEHQIQDGNVYNWQRDNHSYLATNIPGFYIQNATERDEGYYYCKISNPHPAFSNFQIIEKVAYVRIIPCFTISSVDYNITQANCESGSIIKINDEGIRATRPLGYKLVSTMTGDSLTTTANEIKDLKPGTYNLTIFDANNCSVFLENYIHIYKPAGCEKTFTPNGDGIEDNYFISSAGKTRIFTKDGKLVKELLTPAYWDGTDNSGKILPLGYYVIIINDKEKSGVVLID